MDDVTLTVHDGERLSVLGPSGSGKSTLLRAVAGLEPLAAGRISWDGEDLGEVPVHRRGFGLMFQDYVLFPHLDVAANVGFGLDMTGADRRGRGRACAESLALVGLTGFETRLPAELSGGEQQRVALARALAPKPRLLMLDEPLGALDRALRRSLLDELDELLDRISLPIIYVTHDHEEAMAIGDRVAVMHSGRVEAVMPPRELWRQPPTEFVARFLGLNNIIDANVVDGRGTTVIGAISLAPRAHRPGGATQLLIRPDGFRPQLTATQRSMPWSCRPTFRGDHTLLRVRVGNDKDDTEVTHGTESR